MPNSTHTFDIEADLVTLTNSQTFEWAFSGSRITLMMRPPTLSQLQTILLDPTVSELDHEHFLASLKRSWMRAEFVDYFLPDMQANQVFHLPRSIHYDKFDNNLLCWANCRSVQAKMLQQRVHTDNAVDIHSIAQHIHRLIHSLSAPL